MLEQYDIWEAFAKYSTILDDSVIQKLLGMYEYFVNEHKLKFDASRKFWHVRFGPGCPEEWTSKMGIKFMKDWE